METPVDEPPMMRDNEQLAFLKGRKCAADDFVTQIEHLLVASQDMADEVTKEYHDAIGQTVLKT